MPTLDIASQQRYWRRSILIPLWIQQLLIQVSAGVFFWMIISNFWNGLPSGHGGARKSERGILGTFFILYVTLVSVTVAEIVCYAFSYLHSGFYLFLQVAKTGASVCIWTVLFVYPFVVVDRQRQPLEASIFMGVFCFFLQIPMLAALIHAILVKHEERAHDFVWEEITTDQPQIHVEVAETTPLLGHRSANTDPTTV